MNLHLPVIGTLNFVTLYSATTLPRRDDAYSSRISTNGAFRFGTGSVSSVYVRTHSVHSSSVQLAFVIQYTKYTYVYMYVPLP